LFISLVLKMYNTEYLKEIAEIAVETIDFIEKKVHEVVQENTKKERLIDKVVEMVKDHYGIKH